MNNDYLGSKFEDAIELILLYSSIDQDRDNRAMEVLRGLQEAKLEYESLYDYYNANRPAQ